MSNAPASLFTAPLLRAAVKDSFIKLDPRVLVKNPVMFVVAVVALLSTILWVNGLATGTGAPLWGELRCGVQPDGTASSSRCAAASVISAA